METEKKVPAIEKADKIFKYLYYKESATQADISKDLGIPKATTNRLLSVLTELKYLNLEGREYKIGEKFYFFSNKHERYTLIKNIAYPYREELSLKFKETFKISVLDEDKIRSIGKVESSDFIKISVSENAIFPLHAGAASKLLICQLSEGRLNKLLEKTLPKYTENTITDREELKRELLKININKLSFDNMEHSVNIRAVAVPILDSKNRIVAAVSCPCFSDSLTDERALKIAESMRKSCEEISKRLEYFNK
ncbi:IclR family transcriptional regulator [Fusobacterium ulcerans]|uniref:IclR family transcriptional regulator n=1 Tax=Fusobacterium ulcerans TaxID=861 RepID=UPI000E47C68A|nr:IclR family transcriptional regulator [Fusobacterium ulcerans]RGY59726.1 IclR family transcriptional regulator [Fusobacterium ulcerans]